jgi:Zn-finger nucleic acid-binding protein
MLRHAHRDNPSVMVDECPGCGGFWLDAGELGLIRQSHSLVEQKRAHTQALLEQLKQQSLASWPNKAGAGQQRAASIANIQAWVDAGPQ